MRLLREVGLPVLTLLVLIGLVGSGHRHVKAWAPRSTVSDQIRFLPSGKALNFVAMGYDEVIADLLWARATLLFGENFGKGEQDWYTWLYHMMDLATDLDPQFRAAYKYGGTMLRVDGVFVAQSSMIFAKGSHALPEEWYFPFGIAMNYFITKKDNRLAAFYMRKAASLPRSPFYLRNLAATLTDESQGLENALAFLTQELQVVPEGAARRAIEVKIFETRYEIAVRDAETVIREHRRLTGRLPASPPEVTAAGLELPPDPLQGVWKWSDALDADPGAVRSSRYYEVFLKLSQDSGLGAMGLDESSLGAAGPVGVVPDAFHAEGAGGGD